VTRRAHNDEPTRQCIITRELLPKEQLIRFVLDPNDTVTPDLSCKLPGRGMWVKADLASVTEAAVRQAFSRAAKTQAKVPPGLAAQVETQLRKRALDALSLARKAGLVVTGFEKCRSMLEKGEASCLIHAHDSNSDPMRGLDFKGNALPVFECFDRDMLAQVLASDNPVHVALAHGPATEFFILNARRFAGFS